MDTRNTELLDKVAQMNRQLGRLAVQENTANLNVGASSGAWATAYRIFNMNNSAGPTAYFGAAGTNTTLERLYLSIANGTDAPGSAATTAISLLANGNVGIGTNAPTERLHVSNASGVARLLVQSNAAIGRLVATSAGHVVIGSNTANATLSIQSGAGSTGITLLSTGLVGIGTTTPTERLYVDGGNFRLGASGGNFSMNGVGTFGIDAVGVVGGRFFVAADGKVGIGTASPGHLLEVRGQSGEIAISKTVNDGGTRLIFRNVAGSPTKRNWHIATQYNADDTLEITPSTAAGGTNYATPSMVFAPTGNVGIGTTSPGDKLVVGDSGDVAMSVGSTSAGGVPRYVLGNNTRYYDLRVNSTGGQFVIRDISAGWADRFVINTDGAAYFNGNLGVGTTSPARPLHVATGTHTLPTLIGGELMLFDAGVYVANSDAFLNFLSSRNQGFRFGDAADSDAGYIAYEHSTDTLYFGAGAGTRMSVATGGVGIGTSPVAIYQLAVGGNYTQSGSNFYKSGAGNLNFYCDSGSYVALYDSGGGSTNRLGIGTSPATSLHIKASSPEFRLESSSSNQTFRIAAYDNGSYKGELVYAGANAANSRWFGLYHSGGDYLGFYSDTHRHYDTTGTHLYIWNFLSSGTPQVSLLSNALRVNGSNVIVAGSTAIHKFTVYSGNIGPGTDNANTCGTSGTRWSAVWAANGTIQTSDARQKTDIVDTPLGLDFIMKLRPVAYRWKVGGRKEIPIGDGKYDVVDVPGKRTHFGLIAQEVREAIPAGVDFGGWVQETLGDEESTQSLAYHEFIGPLVRAVQELSVRVVNLERALELKEM